MTLEPFNQLQQWTVGQISVLVALIAFPSAAIASLITGTFGYFQARTNRRFEEQRLRLNLEAEQRKFISTLAVQMGIEEYRAMLDQATKAHAIECVVAQRNGMTNMPEMELPYMSQIIVNLINSLLAITKQMEKRNESNKNSST